jgi:hypothetical protein
LSELQGAGKSGRERGCGRIVDSRKFKVERGEKEIEKR